MDSISGRIAAKDYNEILVHMKATHWSFFLLKTITAITLEVVQSRGYGLCA